MKTLCLRVQGVQMAEAATVATTVPAGGTPLYMSRVREEVTSTLPLNSSRARPGGVHPSQFRGVVSKVRPEISC